MMIRPILLLLLLMAFQKLESQTLIPSPLPAAQYQKRGDSFFNEGSYDSALFYFLQARNGYEFNDAKRDAFNIDLGVIRSLLKLNRFDQVEKELRQARKDYEPDQEGAFETLLQLKASLLRKSGKIKEALPVLDSILYFSSDSTFISQAILSKGHTYIALYDLKGANKMLDQALIFVQNRNFQDSTLLVNLWDLQGEVYLKAGNGIKALPYFEKCLDYWQSRFGNTHPNANKFQIKLGILYKNLMQYDKALEYYSQALEQRKKYLGENHLEVSNSYNTIGYLLYKKELYDEAMKIHKKALNIRLSQLSPGDRRILQSIEHIGLCHGGKKEYKKAEEKFSQTLKVRIDKYGQNYHEVGYSYYNLGAVAVEEKDFSKAANYFKTAIDIGKVIYDKYNVDQVDNFNRYANCLLALKDVNGSRLNFQKAIQDNLPGHQWNGDPHQVPKVSVYLSFREIQRSLLGMAATYGVSINPDTLRLALPFLKESERLLHDYRTSFTNENDLVAISSSFKVLADCANEILYKLYRTERRDFYKEEIFRYAELAKSSALMTKLNDEKAKRLSGIPDQSLLREKQFRDDRDSLKNVVLDLLKLEDSEEKSVVANTQLFELNRAYDAFIDSLEQAFPMYFKLKYGSRPLSVQNVQERIRELKRPTVLLQYHVIKNGYFISVIGKEFHEIQLLKIEGLSGNIKAFREQLQMQNVETTDSLSQLLYQSLVSPVSEFIASSDNLAIVPDGIISFVPFDILKRKEENTSYLMMEHDIHYDFSSSLFASRKPKGNNKNRMLAYAPDFQTKNAQEVKVDELVMRSSELVPLPGAKRELDLLATLLEGDFLKGRKATKQHFKEEATNYDIIHLATHSVVNEKDHDYSKLVFSETSEDDGSLYAFELSNVALNAHLVTLSACNTGIGNISKGEGVMSLARSFRSAEVPSVVMSLWPASDKSTPDLMKYFYQNLKEGQSKDVALNNARKQYLATAQGKARHPFYWGGFVLIGDSSPIEEQQNTSYWWLSIGLLLTFVSVALYSKRAII